MVDRPSFDSSFTEESSISPRACPALHWGLRGCESSEARRGVSPAINLGGEECRSPVHVCWLMLNYGHRGHKTCRFSDGASNLVSCRTGCRRASARNQTHWRRSRCNFDENRIGTAHSSVRAASCAPEFEVVVPPKKMKHMMQGAVFCLGGILTLTMNGS